jgi:hypothetical protein
MQRYATADFVGTFSAWSYYLTFPHWALEMAGLELVKPVVHKHVSEK